MMFLWVSVLVSRCLSSVLVCVGVWVLVLFVGV